MGLSISLIDHLTRAVTRVGHTYHLRDSDKDEVLSEALLRLAKSLPRIKGNPRNYIFKLVRSTIVDYHRAKKYLRPIDQLEVLEDFSLNQVFFNVLIEQLSLNLNKRTTYIIRQILAGGTLNRRDRDYLRYNQKWLQNVFKDLLYR